MPRFFRNSLTFLLLSLMVSCDREYQEIEFKEFIISEISDVENGFMTLKGNLRFFNPNSKQVRLTKANIHILIKEDTVANVKPDGKIKIRKKSEFIIPVTAKVEMKKVDWMGSLLSVLGGKHVNLRFKGYIVVTSWLIPYQIPVDHEQPVKF